MNRLQRTELIAALRAKRPGVYEQGKATSVIAPGVISPPEWVELVERLRRAVEGFEEQTEWFTEASKEWCDHAEHWHNPETLVADMICLAIRPELGRWLETQRPAPAEGRRMLNQDEWDSLIDCVLAVPLARDMLDAASAHTLCFIVDETRHEAMQVAFIHAVLNAIAEVVDDGGMLDMLDRVSARNETAEIAEILHERIAQANGARAVTLDEVIDQELGPTGPPGVVGPDPEGDGGVP